MPRNTGGRIPSRNDYTSTFQSLVTRQTSQYPPSSSKTLQRVDPPPNVVKAQQQWLTQAYVIRRHILSLLAFLYSIRRPYLSVSGSTSHRLPFRSNGTDGSGDIETDESNDGLFSKWQSFQGPLTDVQRDEIDFQVKVVVKKCLESVKDLERAEEARKKSAPTTPTALSPLYTLLSLSTPRDSSSSILASFLISAHRSSVIHYLSTLLSKASALQSDMQETRLKVQREKSRSLSNCRAQIAAEQKPGSSSTSSGQLAPIQGSVGGSFHPEMESETSRVGKDIRLELTPSQIQMLESESSDLIKSLESELASIQKAESRLYEISDLQNQVVQQLEQQSEITDRLLDEAIGVGTEVERGNEELRKARQRSREADKMLAVFLVGSGLALLFLHWMD